ncbi:MAG: hypothetical protein Nkreftii_001337 [Candidatus Nitrospira kreftii]|uniref:Uncharacterized protein n=1 Tax=Candidatus Nitrospira kreftii TaxID=2652173 RepID=A0A7S8FCY7_9BACT|nr:MAG: hypothetical protein Nkreftii_001337 [Candidatus Nitrospira kreftii]
MDPCYTDQTDRSVEPRGQLVTEDDNVGRTDDVIGSAEADYQNRKGPESKWMNLER